MAQNNSSPVTLLPASVAAAVPRAVYTWFATCEYLPTGVAVSFEDLPPNDPGICLSTVQSPAYAARYILGGYRAEYRFRVIYRILPSDSGDMLDAVELLGNLAAWCEDTIPPEITGAVNVKINRTSDATILVAYDDGSSDYAVSLSMTWEVF